MIVYKIIQSFEKKNQMFYLLSLIAKPFKVCSFKSMKSLVIVRPKSNVCVKWAKRIVFIRKHVLNSENGLESIFFFNYFSLIILVELMGLFIFNSYE